MVIMGTQDPDFPEPADEATWIGHALSGEVVMVPEAGHYPQSQQPGPTSEAILRFLDDEESAVVVREIAP